MDRSPELAGQSSRTADASKMFTVSQAAKALVLVRRIVQDIVDEYAHLLELQEMTEGLQRHGSIESLEGMQERMAASVARLHACTTELDEIGVELRDYGRGIVDFPCFAGGREVRLCWRLGEPAVACWHEVGEGLAHRKPITALEAYQPVIEVNVNTR